jgi:AcrR family transcriptional regulator
MASTDKTQTAGSRLRPGPSALPRGQVTEIQRSRMLTAAAQAVEEVGYARMTVAQVISRAKVSRKTFYDVFVDREDCFLATFEQAIAQARAPVVEAYEQETSWREGMRAGLGRMLQFMDEEPGLARICVLEALGAGPRVLEVRARALDELAAVVDHGRSVGGAGTREPPQVTAEGVVGAVFAVIHTRLLEQRAGSFTNLLGPLMSMIVLPYLGARTAGKELSRPAPRGRRRARGAVHARSRDPLEGLQMRLTYRTVRVLVVIGTQPGASNREIAEGSGIIDQGQISKLLTRLQRLELVENRGGGQLRGAANAWYLTERGAEVERAARPR